MALPGGAHAAAVVLLLWGGLASAAAQPPPPPPAPAPARPASPQTDRSPSPAPSEQPAPDASALPSDPERIRRALSRPATLLPAVTSIEVDGATFRVSVNQKPFDIWEFWGSDTAASSDARSWYFSNWHHEYLRMVTPDYGRRAALYPSGMLPSLPIIPSITNAIERALRRRAERKAKDEVRQALEDFFAQHPEARAPAPSAPDKPVP